MSDIRNRLIRLAYENPQYRDRLLPLIKKLSGGKHAPSYMTVSHLQKLAVQSLKLLKMVDQNTPLDDWVESHVTEAASKMDSVYEHLMYPNEGPVAGKVADDKKFEDAVEGKKFKHPETGNDVKFESLPSEEQKKVRKKWKKKNKEKGGGDKKERGKGELPSKDQWSPELKSKKDVKKNLNYLRDIAEDKDELGVMGKDMLDAMSNQIYYNDDLDASKDDLAKAHKALEKATNEFQDPVDLDEASAEEIRMDIAGYMDVVNKDEAMDALEALADHMPPDTFSKETERWNKWFKEN